MAEEKSPGFLKRVFGRFGGKKEAPEQVEQETVAPEAVPEPPKPAPKPKPPVAEKPAAKPKPVPKKKKPAKPATVQAKAPAPKKAPKKEPATKPAAKKAPVKKTEPAAAPAPKKKPVAKKAKPVAARKPVESKEKPLAKELPKTVTPSAQPEPASEPKSQTVLTSAVGPKVDPAPERVPEPTPAPKEPPSALEPAPEPIPALQPEPKSEPGSETPPEPELEIAPQVEEQPTKKGWFSRLKEGLTRSSNQLTENIAAVFTKRKLDDDTLQDLEDVLIQADLGIETAMNITEEVARGRFNKEISDHEIREILGAEVAKVLAPVAIPLKIHSANKPHIILVVGVNGTGKTTTIGKLAAKFRGEGKSVMLAAGDTFRAAAIDQLKIWGERVGASVIARDVGADSSGLAFDAIRDAREQNIDVLLIDTAGRLQNQDNLMAELEKVRRVIGKQDETAPHDVLLVLDATTGQNALQQVEIFGKVADVTGLVMTKLDGTARGGILVAISAKYGLPVHAIGVGETVDDLQPFEAAQFANAIAGIDEEATVE